MNRLAFVGVACAMMACHPTPNPPDVDAGPGPTIDASPSADTAAGSVSPTGIWNALLEAGCVAPDDGGPMTIAQEEALDADAWLACMAAGGSVQACGAPCSDAN